MNTNAIKISKNFRKMAIKSVWSILLFMCTYLLLIALAIAFTILCGYAGIMIIVLKPMFITGMLGLGLISVGFLILIFLIKFIFSKSKIDRSHLVLLSEQDQPELFKLIREIVDEVKTDFPKHIYLSSEVNASVFYDSSFWSMIFPVRKNLQIGLGLLNSISITELKAILAHEFGHFSQRSMKVGSYVYNVNKVIYNLLYENDSYSSLIQRWASFSSYFAVFVHLAIKIISGIQNLLKKVYDVVNLSYMALSREMEFHADAVAAQVAGSQPLINSLMRLELADQSLNAVFKYYDGKISEAVKTDNLYPQQHFVLNFLAEKNNLPVQAGLPIVSEAHYKRFNKTKLVLKDQWSSHPSTEDRVKALKALNKETRVNNEAIASTLLSNSERVQEKVTQQIFNTVIYPKQASVADKEQFSTDYAQYYKENTYPEIYNGYFDYRNLLSENLESYYDAFNTVNSTAAISGLFGEQAIDAVYTSNAIASDLEVLEQISSGALRVKTFDYDGQKYEPADCYTLIAQLKKEQENLEADLKLNDRQIFGYFYTVAVQRKLEADFKALYDTFSVVSAAGITQMEVYANLSNVTQFIQQTMPFEVIKQNMLTVKAIEKSFKTALELLLSTTAYQPYLTEEIKLNLEKYLSNDWLYFNVNAYDNDALNLMFQAMNNFYYLVQTTHFKLKKKILDFQADLLTEA